MNEFMNYVFLIGKGTVISLFVLATFGLTIAITLFVNNYLWRKHIEKYYDDETRRSLAERDLEIKELTNKLEVSEIENRKYIVAHRGAIGLMNKTNETLNMV